MRLLRNRTRISHLAVLLGLAFLAAVIGANRGRPLHDPAASPRTVTPANGLGGEEKNNIRIFEKVAPAVVFINTITLERDFFSLNIYEIPKGTGSGFVWDKEGRIVTNFHVIEGASKVEVTLADSSTWKAALVGAAPDKDIAVLKISAPPERLTPIPLGTSSDLKVGQKVLAIGNPFGLDQTMTSGIVSALGREIKSVTGRKIRGVIQTDAPINPGNSGGPLLDSSGRLIGMNTAIYSPSGASAGIGFAVPVDEINRVVPVLIREGRLVRPGLAVSVAEKSLARRLGVKAGVLVIRVWRGSNAEKAGLRGTYRVWGGIRLGDVIIGVNGEPVNSYDDLLSEFEKHRVGERVALQIIRNGRPEEVEVTLEEVE